MRENSEVAPGRIRGVEGVTGKPTFRDLLPTILFVLFAIAGIRWLWRATR